MCLPDSWLLWNVKSFTDINSETLAILDLIDPAPEVLVVGCGAAIKTLPAHLQQFLKDRGIATEVLDTVSVQPQQQTWHLQQLCQQEQPCITAC